MKSEAQRITELEERTTDLMRYVVALLICLLVFMAIAAREWDRQRRALLEHAKHNEVQGGR